MFDNDNPRTRIGKNGKLDGDSVKLPKSPKLQLVNWDLLSEQELMEAYSEIEVRLPPRALSQMNLEKELLMQFHTLRALQVKIMDDDDTPANQKAQVGNSVSSALNKLNELQESIYTSERFKMIEGMLIRWLQTLPEDQAAALIDQYEAVLKSNA